MPVIPSKLTVLISLILLAFSTQAGASDISECEGKDLNLKIAACSRLIESGQLEGKPLASAHNNRGVGFIRSGRQAMAIAEFDAAIQVDHGHYKAWHNRGSAHVETGQLDKALSDYNKAIELKPDWARAYGQRGLVHFFKSSEKSALADLNKAIDLKPDGALIYNNRGVVHEAIGQVDKAIADYRMALKIDPSLEIAKTNLHSLLSEVVSAGLKKRKPARSGNNASKATLINHSTQDGIRFGLRAQN